MSSRLSAPTRRHVQSKHEKALPIIVAHGWPGSIIEQLKIIDPLTNPTASGGSASDAFDIVRGGQPRTFLDNRFLASYETTRGCSTRRHCCAGGG
jgi:hypothetical protein